MTGWRTFSIRRLHTNAKPRPAADTVKLDYMMLRKLDCQAGAVLQVCNQKQAEC